MNVYGQRYLRLLSKVERAAVFARHQTWHVSWLAKLCLKRIIPFKDGAWAMFDKVKWSEAY